MKYIPFFLLILFSTSAISEEIAIDDVMTDREKEAIGIDTFSPQQLSAFLQWLETWTKKTIDQAPSYHPSQSLQTWVYSWPLFMQSRQKHDSKALKISEELASKKIRRNRNGMHIELKDGSLWKVSKFDQEISKIWQREDLIEILENCKDISRPYILINQTKQQKIGAFLEKKKGSPPASPVDTPHFQTAKTVRAIDLNLNRVVLNDMSIWKIAPLDHIYLQNTWKISDRIQIELGNETAYSTKLKNLDSGDIISGIKIK